MADAARYEDALAHLDGVRGPGVALFQRWLIALTGSPPAVRRDPRVAPPRMHAIPGAVPPAVITRLEREVPALEALAARHGPLLARGTPEIVPGREAMLLRLWGDDGTCASYVWTGRLEAAAAGVARGTVRPAGAGAATALTGPPGWLVLSFAESVPLALSCDARVLRFEAGQVAVSAPVTITATPERAAGCGELVSGLAPVPAAPGLALELEGRLPAGGEVLDPLPARAEAPDAPLFGWFTPCEGFKNDEIKNMTALLAVAQRWGAPVRAPRLLVLKPAPGVEHGWSRGGLIALAGPGLLAHECAHAALAGGRRGWPGRDPEEGVAEWLAARLAKAAGVPHTPLSREPVDPFWALPLARGLASDRLPRPFLTERPGARPSAARLTARLAALDARLGGDRLPRALMKLVHGGGGPLTLGALAELDPELAKP